MQDVYIITATYRDGVNFVHTRCFAHELAARCEAEMMAEGSVNWISPRYGEDEKGTEFEIGKLFMWRLGETVALSAGRPHP